MLSKFPDGPYVRAATARPSHGGGFKEIENLDERIEVLWRTPSELAEHFVVGEDLPRVLGAELEKLSRQRGLVDARHREDVLLDVRFDEGTEDVVAPTGFFPAESGTAGMAVVQSIDGVRRPLAVGYGWRQRSRSPGTL